MGTKINNCTKFQNIIVSEEIIFENWPLREKLRQALEDIMYQKSCRGHARGFQEVMQNMKNLQRMINTKWWPTGNN